MTLLSFQEYITEAGSSAERQENAFVKAVNDAVANNEGLPIKLTTKGGAELTGVVKAEKFEGRQVSGSEPYTDVQIFTGRGIKNVSMKGPAAPSLAGGGLRGIETLLPGLGVRFIHKAYNHLIKKKKLKAGDKVPDVYGILNDEDKELLVIGNRAIGGPAHFMYIGGMDVKFKVNSNGDLNISNGKLIPAKKFADDHDLVFRFRARRNDQRFDPDAADKNGVPKIYGKSPSRGDSAGRLVVTDSVPKSAIIIKF